MKVCGNTGVSDIVLLCVIEKGVLDLHIIAAKDVDKLLAACVDVPIQAITCVFKLISARTESNMLQNHSCCLSLQGKYTYISATEMYLPLMHLPRLSKEVI